MDSNEVDVTSQDQENLAHDVMDSLGMPAETISEQSEEDSPKETAKEEDPEVLFKRRLGTQAKRHAKEMREMRQELSALRQLAMGNQNPESREPSDLGGGDYATSEEEKIKRAVKLALHAKEQEEAKLKERERLAHVHKQYQKLQDRLDNAVDKYEDFDQVVRADDAPFTDAMRDAVLLIDNPEEVLYKLGKDKEQLKRISALHPFDQAREVIKLSMALMGGKGSSESNKVSRSIPPMKGNPVGSSRAVTDKTPVSDLRRMMRANWK